MIYNTYIFTYTSCPTSECFLAKAASKRDAFYMLQDHLRDTYCAYNHTLPLSTLREEWDCYRVTKEL